MFKLSDEYANAEAPDASFPLGSFKDEVTPGVSGDGTPYQKKWPNDLIAFQQSLLAAAGITASGLQDTIVTSQQMQGLVNQIMTAAQLVDSGAADAYVLDELSGNYDTDSLKDRQVINWIATNANTGASTANTFGHGAKNIFSNGVALTGGEILSGEYYTMRYDLGNDRYNLVSYGNNLGDANAVTLAISGVAPSAPVANTLYSDSLCKAWLNMDGTGTIAIRDDFNISGIVDNATGDYSAVIDTDFADTNYVGVGNTSDDTNRKVVVIDDTGVAVGSFRIKVVDMADGLKDSDIINLVFFGRQ